MARLLNPPAIRHEGKVLLLLTLAREAEHERRIADGTIAVPPGSTTIPRRVRARFL